MKSKLVRIGNSFGVRLPRQALAKAGFATERPVSVRVARGRIVIEADSNELADEARRQSLRVSARPARDAGFWESLADESGWK
jgi:antitoxin component of MazEF toxin-antitoxin module